MKRPQKSTHFNAGAARLLAVAGLVAPMTIMLPPPVAAASLSPRSERSLSPLVLCLLRAARVDLTTLSSPKNDLVIQMKAKGIDGFSRNVTILDFGSRTTGVPMSVAVTVKPLEDSLDSEVSIGVTGSHFSPEVRTSVLGGAIYLPTEGAETDSAGETYFRYDPVTEISRPIDDPSAELRRIHREALACLAPAS